MKLVIRAHKCMHYLQTCKTSNIYDALKNIILVSVKSMKYLNKRCIGDCRRLLYMSCVSTLYMHYNEVTISTTGV